MLRSGFDVEFNGYKEMRLYEISRLKKWKESNKTSITESNMQNNTGKTPEKPDKEYEVYH